MPNRGSAHRPGACSCYRITQPSPTQLSRSCLWGIWPRPRLPAHIFPESRGEPVPLPSGWGLALGQARHGAGQEFVSWQRSGWLQAAGHSQLPGAATGRGSWPRLHLQSRPPRARRPGSHPPGFPPIVQGGPPPPGPSAWEGASTGPGVQDGHLGEVGGESCFTDHVARTKARDKTNQGSHIVSVSLSTRLREFSHLSP